MEESAGGHTVEDELLDNRWDITFLKLFSSKINQKFERHILLTTFKYLVSTENSSNKQKDNRTNLSQALYRAPRPQMRIHKGLLGHI